MIDPPFAGSASVTLGSVVSGAAATSRIAGLPAGTAAGMRCARSVSLLDIYPTLIELCGLESRAGLGGRSLVPLLQDPKAEWNRPVVTTQGRKNHSVRGDRWRLIRYADGSEELYDHAGDPHEWNNVANESANEAVKKRLAAWLPKHDAPAAKTRRVLKRK